MEFKTRQEIVHMTTEQLLAYCERTGWEDEEAIDELNDREADALYEEYPEDTPSIQNCDDWGTGEGKYHGRM